MISPLLVKSHLYKEIFFEEKTGFFLPLEEGDDLKRMANRLSQARQSYQKRNEGVRFTQRMWEKDDVVGIRIWRVE